MKPIPTINSIYESISNDLRNKLNLSDDELRKVVNAFAAVESAQIKLLGKGYMNFKVICMTVAALFIWYGLVYCDEWPDWRGPNRDGTWQETGVKKTFASPHI